MKKRILWVIGFALIGLHTMAQNIVLQNTNTGKKRAITCAKIKLDGLASDNRGHYFITGMDASVSPDGTLTLKPMEAERDHFYEGQKAGRIKLSYIETSGELLHIPLSEIQWIKTQSKSHFRGQNLGFLVTFVGFMGFVAAPLTGLIATNDQAYNGDLALRTLRTSSIIMGSGIALSLGFKPRKYRINQAGLRTQSKSWKLLAP